LAIGYVLAMYASLCPRDVCIYVLEMYARKVYALAAMWQQMREHRQNTGARGAIRSRRVVAKAAVSHQLVPAVSLPAGPVWRLPACVAIAFVSLHVSLSPLFRCTCHCMSIAMSLVLAMPLRVCTCPPCSGGGEAWWSG